MYVCYCRTYEKAVSGGGEGKGRTCAEGHLPLAAACAFESGHLTLLSGAGEGEVASKEVGEEEEEEKEEEGLFKAELSLS